VFNVPHHPTAFPACDSDTHRPSCPTLRMCLSLVLKHASRDIQAYQAVKRIIDSYDLLVDLLESIDHFLNRLDIYTKIPPTIAMTEVVVKILVELLAILALATKHIKQGKPSESVFGDVSYNLTRCNAEKLLKKLLGEKEVEAVLQRLDRLTVDEARITAAQTLQVVHGLFQNMKKVMDGEQYTRVVTRWMLNILPFRWRGIG
jgi:hypothetical protein